MKEKLQGICTKKNLALLCLTILLLSLIPLLYVGRYDHPTGDDIYYGVDAHLAWESTHSLPRTIASAWQGTVQNYYTWQGTYSAMLLMHLQPTVFSENCYFLTPFLIVGLMLWGGWYLLRQISRYVIPLDRYGRIGIWSVLMLFILQGAFSPGEAFYWYNGGMYYTGFFGLTLLMFGLLCKYAATAKKRTLILMLFMELLIGGGNYLTLLWAMIVLVLTAALQWLRKCPDWGGRIGLTCAALFQIACFVVNAVAPGNAMRAATTVQTPAFKAILLSLRQGIAYFSIWLNGWWILGAMVLLCFILPVIRKMSFSFSYPLPVLAFLYGMFCALSCPTFYAQSNTGPARAVNVCYYGFILTSYVALFYLTGWIYKKWNCPEEYTAALRPIYCRLLLFALALQLAVGLVDNTFLQTTGMQALQDIISGTAAAYDQEYRERIRLLETSAEPDIVFMPYQHRPHTVYVGDYGGDGSFGTNLALAAWYGHRSVIVDYSASE
ncbi:MAG: hypothetical protein NC517_11750 [Firmicutes bacterium]|nr:hypothetical protein [Bacillota bacterium]